MDTTGYVALSRQLALQRQLTALAGNVANASTSGYKAGQLRSFEVALDAGSPGRLSFTGIATTGRDPSQGEIVATGARFDLAISGPGMFAVMTPQGERFTRAGHFEPDPTGALVTARGYRLLDEGGAPVVVPDPGPAEVTRDGVLTGPDGPVARLRVVDPGDMTGLGEEEAGLYVSSATLAPVARPLVLQGSLEGSNVRPIMAMTRLIETLRAFEGTQRLLDTRHELARRVIERVGGREA